jgi:hypothetical protein
MTSSGEFDEAGQRGEGEIEVYGDIIRDLRAFHDEIGHLDGWVVEVIPQVVWCPGGNQLGVGLTDGEADNAVFAVRAGDVECEGKFVVHFDRDCAVAVVSKGQGAKLPDGGAVCDGNGGGKTDD